VRIFWFGELKGNFLFGGAKGGFFEGLCITITFYESQVNVM